MQLAAQYLGEKEVLSRYDSGSISYRPGYLPCYPNVNPLGTIDHISLINLNGCSAYGKKKSVLSNTDLDPSQIISDMSEVNEIHFAWEESKYHDYIESNLLSIIEGTTVLVCIGYSFPFLNRMFDKKLFQKIKPTLSKIYFQDPVLTGNELYSKFDLTKEIDIVHIPQTQSFHIPFEY